MRAKVIAGTMTCLAMVGLAMAADDVKYGPPSAWVKPVVLGPDDGAMLDAPSKFLLRNHQLRFTPTSSEMYVESYFRVQTAQGLQGLGGFALPWRPDSDTLTIHAFRLIRDGRVIDALAGGKKFEVLRRENNLELDALDGVLTAALQPDGVEVGDLLNISFSIQRESKLLEFAELRLSESRVAPLSRLEWRAVWDKSTPLRWRASQDTPGVRESRHGNEVELSWTATGIAPVDQPVNVPVRFWREPSIEFSTFKSWQDVSRRLAPLYATAVQLAPDSPLRAQAKTIAAASPDPVERLEAALKLTQERIRYVFLGMGDGGLDPAPVDTTWQRRFGDCKAKSAMLIALLRELGIEAEPVAVNTRMGDAVADRLPGLSAFDHIIVRARIGERTYWLDGAGSQTWRRADMRLPNYRWGLPVSTRGEGLLPMDAPPLEAPQTVTSTVIDARAGLYTDVPFTAELRVFGAAGAQMQATLTQLDASGREQALRAFWKQEYDFVEPGEVSADFEDATGATTLRMQGTADMDWSGFTYTADGMRVGAQIDFARKEAINKDAPFFVSHPAYTLVRQRIELPVGANFSIRGANHDVTLAGVNYRRNASLNDGVFTAEASTRSLVPEVSAAQARADQPKLKALWDDRLEVVATNYLASDADVAALRKRKYDSAADLMWRGQLFLSRQDYTAAIADFEAVSRLEPDQARGIAHRGLTHFWKQDMAAARADLEAALKIEPTNAVALRGLGAVMRSSDDFREAVRLLTESLRTEPDDTFALWNRAFAYMGLEEVQPALEDAAKVIRLRPAAIDMYELRVRLLEEQGQAEAVRREVQAMLVANPDDPAALLAAASHYSRVGRYVDAVSAMDRVIAKAPTADNYVARSDFRDPSDLAGRASDADAAIAADPEHRRAWYVRAYLHSIAGEYDAAIAIQTARMKTATPSVRRALLAQRGLDYRRAGKMAESGKDLAEALAGSPEPREYNTFCWALGIAGLELEQALAACDRALAGRPDYPVYLDSRALVLLGLGRLEEAIATYDKALAARPKQSTSLYGRGIAKNRRCGCKDGEADIKAAKRGDAYIERTFERAKLAPGA